MPILYGADSGMTKPKKGPIRKVTHKGEIIPKLDPVRATDAALHPDGMVVAISAIEGRTPAALFKRFPNNTFYFQCSPLESLPRDKDWVWDDFGTIGSGMHSNPNYPGLPSVSFETLLVDESFGWSPGPRLVAHAGEGRPVVDPFAARPGDAASATVVPGPRFAVADLVHDPVWAVQWLELLGDAMEPFALQWGQPALWGRWDRVTAATLRSLHVEERAGEVDARYLRVAFTEYPDADAKAAPLPAVPGARKPGSHNPRVLATLDSSKLPPGKRTLAQLAKNYYGQASAWRLIQRASGLKGVTANQDLRATVGRRHPPAKIVIPKRPASSKPRPWPTRVH